MNSREVSYAAAVVWELFDRRFDTLILWFDTYEVLVTEFLTVESESGMCLILKIQFVVDNSIKVYTYKYMKEIMIKYEQLVVSASTRIHGVM